MCKFVKNKKDMGNLYRRYKISQITNEGITQKEKETVEFILDKIKDLTIVVDEEGNRNYMNSKGELELQFDFLNILYFKYKDFWLVLLKKYSLNIDDIEYIMKSITEDILKIKPRGILGVL